MCVLYFHCTLPPPPSRWTWKAEFIFNNWRRNMIRLDTCCLSSSTSLWSWLAVEEFPWGGGGAELSSYSVSYERFTFNFRSLQILSWIYVLFWAKDNIPLSQSYMYSPLLRTIYLFPLGSANLGVEMGKWFGWVLPCPFSPAWGHRAGVSPLTRLFTVPTEVWRDGIVGRKKDS